MESDADMSARFEFFFLSGFFLELKNHTVARGAHPYHIRAIDTLYRSVQGIAHQMPWCADKAQATVNTILLQLSHTGFQSTSRLSILGDLLRRHLRCSETNAMEEQASRMAAEWVESCFMD